MTVSQKLIGLQRGFSPLQVTGLVAWYDASDISTLWQDAARTSAITTNGQAVLGVTDKSASGFHLSEATNGPTYTTGAQNGKSAIAFDGTNDKLSSAAFTVSQPNTLLIAAKVIAHSGTKAERFVDAVTARQLISNGGAANWTYYAGTLQSGSIAADTSYHQFTAIFNGASSSFRVDAASASTANPNTNALTSLKLGVDNAAEFYNIQIGEWLAYSASLSSTNRDAIEAYLKAKWGTP